VPTKWALGLAERRVAGGWYSAFAVVSGSDKLRSRDDEGACRLFGYGAAPP